jgi:hypothetical protein
MHRRTTPSGGRWRAVRAWVLGASGCAALVAASIAVAPALVGAGSVATDQSFLNQDEGGGFDHNDAHQEASPQAIRTAAADAQACAAAERRGEDDLETCPADPPAPAQEQAAQAEGQRVEVAATTQPDGMWGPLQQIPSTAIHAVLLPTNKVLWFSQPKWPVEDPEAQGGNAHLWDPATNTSVAVPPPVVDYPSGPDRAANLWCGGQTLLADGRVLVVGGNLEYPDNDGKGPGNGFKGGKWVMTFDPWTETWTRYADMDHGRWYPTLTELEDGRVLIIGGWDETGGTAAGPGDPAEMANNLDIEVFDPSTPPGGVATSIPAALPKLPAWREGLGLYPHQFLLPDTTALGAGGGKVLIAGPLAWDSSVIDTRNWTWQDINGNWPGSPLSSDRSWGTAWMEPSGPDGSRRVVLLGGSNTASAAPGDPGTGTPPLASAEVLDLDRWWEGWRPDPSLELNTGRAHFNSVLLPDGSILSNGGGFGRKDGSLYAEPVYGAELLAPGGGGWRAVGQEADARTYHSTALLLADGRVVSAGDDRDILPSPVPAGSPPGTPPGHIALGSRTAQVYSPPYLFAGPRPAVTFAPSAVRYDAPFRVAVGGSSADVTRAVLVRPGAVTHAVDMSQQVIELNVTAQADGLTMTSPLNPSVAPPGYYMLYLLNDEGVPSVASWVRLDPNAPPAPPLPGAPPAPAAPAVPAPAPPPSSAPARPGAVRPPAAAARRRPVLRVRSAKATVRGRTVTVRLSVTTNRRAKVTARLVRARGQRGRVVSQRAPRRTVRAGRAVTLAPRARVSRALPRRVRVRLRAVDAHGTRSTRTVTVRVPRASPRR